MLTALYAVNSAGSRLDLPLGDSSSGYLITDITGLDPVKATFTTATLANYPGTAYRGGTRESRNVVVSMDLLWPNNQGSIHQIRQKLYDFFNPGEIVTLGVMIGDAQLGELVGRTETVEVVMFSKDPALSISIMCFDPDIIAPEVEQSGFTTHSTEVTEIFYEGSIPTGFVLEIGPLTQAKTSVTTAISSRAGDFAMTINDTLVVGDSVKISTVRGDKFVKRIRAGTENTILYAVTVNSRWAMLHPGINQFKVSLSGSAQAPYKIRYLPRYGGI